MELVVILVGLVVVIGVIAAIALFVWWIVKLASNGDKRPPVALAQAALPGLAPGWYPDQHDPAVMRYFDGQRWTAGTSPRE